MADTIRLELTVEEARQLAAKLTSFADVVECSELRGAYATVWVDDKKDRPSFRIRIGKEPL